MRKHLSRYSSTLYTQLTSPATEPVTPKQDQDLGVKVLHPVEQEPQVQGAVFSEYPVTACHQLCKCIFNVPTQIRCHRRLGVDNWWLGVDYGTLVDYGR